MILNSTQVTNYLYNAGFRGVDLKAAIKICNCESGFNTNAHNTTGEDSRGLMQINVNAHPNYEYLNLFDPQINCNVAYELYSKRGKTFKDWTCARTLNLVNPKNIIFGTGIVFIGIAVYIYAAQ
jgi:hypothetical protein